MNLTLNEIDVSFDLINMKVFPDIDGNQNVVGRVDWIVTFSAQGQEVKGGGSTDLNVYNIPNFISIDQLTKQDIINFVIDANGGNNWVQKLKDIHFEYLWRKLLESQMIDHPLPQN